MKVKDLPFETWRETEDDTLVGVYVAGLGRFTVLDRMTGYGYGIRDIETGFCDLYGYFWLASSQFDIRDYPEFNLEQAVAVIKKYANTCTGE